MIRLNPFKALIDVIYPNRCPYCNNIIDINSLCCDTCDKNIKSCVSIRKISIRNSNLDVICISPLKYDSEIIDAFHRFKFRGHKSYAKEFANRITNSLIDNFPNKKFDFITSVPLSTRRKFERGYNQSEIISKNISRELSIPYKNVIVKVKKNKIQHTLSFDKRIENVKGAYLAKNLDIINGSNILLCDDVITTGSTLAECAKVLFDANAKSVMCVTFASVELKHKTSVSLRKE